MFTCHAGEIPRSVGTNIFIWNQNSELIHIPIERATQFKGFIVDTEPVNPAYSIPKQLNTLGTGREPEN